MGSIWVARFSYPGATPNATSEIIASPYHMKLTAQTIRIITAPEGKADFVAWDDALPGFGLRLRGRSRSWVIQYRIGQQQRRESLGDVRKVTLDSARTIARTKFAQIQLGAD